VRTNSQKLLSVNPQRNNAKEFLGCLRDAARSDTGSAHTNMLTHAVNHCANSLQIWVPAAASGIIRMADDVAKTRPFAAKLTSHCHKYSSSNFQKLAQSKQFSKVPPLPHLIYRDERSYTIQAPRRHNHVKRFEKSLKIGVPTVGV